MNVPTSVGELSNQVSYHRLYFLLTRTARFTHESLVQCSLTDKMPSPKEPIKLARRHANTSSSSNGESPVEVFQEGTITKRLAGGILPIEDGPKSRPLEGSVLVTCGGELATTDCNLTQEQILDHRSTRSAQYYRRVPVLNEDVVESILRYLVDTELAGGCLNQSFLSSICRVSKTWLRPARRQTYKSIRLPPHRQELFLQTISESPDMGRFVRFLELNVSDPIFNHLRLFPNITGIHVSDLEKCHLATLLQLSRVRQFVYARDRQPGVRWAKCHWARLSKAWQSLETLEFRRCVSPFRPGDTTTLHQSTLLHTLTWRDCPRLSPNCIPHIRPHTLHTIILDGVGKVKKGFFRTLIGEHAQSLERLHVEHCGDLLSASIPIYEAQRLQYLSIHTRMYGWLVTINGRLPTSLIEISLDQPGYRSVRALKFLRQRSGGPLKHLSVSLDYFSPHSDWNKVRAEALGMGITFSAIKTSFQVSDKNIQINTNL